MSSEHKVFVSVFALFVLTVMVLATNAVIREKNDNDRDLAFAKAGLEQQLVNNKIIWVKPKQ